MMTLLALLDLETPRQCGICRRLFWGATIERHVDVVHSDKGKAFNQWEKSSEFSLFGTGKHNYSMK